MLHNLAYYCKKAQESGFKDLNGMVFVYEYHWTTNQFWCWPEVETHLDFLKKCYSIASEVPFESLVAEYNMAKQRGKKALENVHLKVVYWMNVINNKDIDHKMGYTPISHIREQLISLWEVIDNEIFCLKSR